MKKNTRIILAIIELFVAIGAIPAGFAMLNDPTGAGLGMTTNWLKGSPFHTFFLPGLYLFGINGISNLINSILLFRKYKFAGIIGLFLGILLVLWIIVQVIIIGFSSVLQPIYFVIGLIEIILSLIVINKAKIYA